MVVDAQVDDDVGETCVAAVCLHHEERSGLLAAPVATSGLGGGEAFEQPLAGRHQELYVVLSGRATFTVDGEEVDAPAGTIVFAGDPGTRRAALAREDGTTVLVVGAPAGEPYTVGRWESMAGFFDFYNRGDYEGGIAFLEDCLRRDPGYPGVLYNLACCESLAGRGDEAVEHLRAALEGEPGLRESALDDEDFAPLRDHPRFQELVA